MSLKKALGVIGIVLAIALLILAGLTVITLRLFWLGLILLAALAYVIIPRLPD